MKSLLLYDFVGLYLAILCNPYYGYPIASKNEDTCDGCRKYLRWSLKVLTLVIESTCVGHRKYFHFFCVFLLLHIPDKHDFPILIVATHGLPDF